MKTSEENELIADLARELVRQAAPQEMPLFKATSEAYFKDPRQVLNKARAEEEALAFGASESIAFLTPILLMIGKEVVAYLQEEAKKTLKTEGAAAVNEFIKRIFRGKQAAAAAPASTATASAAPAAQPASPALNQEQARQVWQIAYQQAMVMRLSETRAKLLADSVIGSLVLSTAAQAP